MADYLHRVGRTARGGRAGRVTTITPRRYWPFVAKIQEATQEGREVMAWEEIWGKSEKGGAGEGCYQKI